MIKMKCVVECKCLACGYECVVEFAEGDCKTKAFRCNKCGADQDVTRRICGLRLEQEHRMTPEEFAVKMRALIYNWLDDSRPNNYHHSHIELAHKDADKLLCEVLRELGYGVGVDVYESFSKWYE